MRLNNKGFAISSVLFVILVLAMLLLFATIALLSNRKTLLDKTKTTVKEELINIKKYDEVIEMLEDAIYNYVTDNSIELSEDTNKIKIETLDGYIDLNDVNIKKYNLLNKTIAYSYDTLLAKIVITNIYYESYIEDGLILYLDGIKNNLDNHGYEISSWKDLSKSTYDGIIGESISISDKYMYSKNMDEDTFVNLPYTFNLNDYTIEIVFEIEYDQEIEIPFLFSFDNGFGLYLENDMYKISEDSNLGTLEYGKIITMSITNGNQYMNSIEIANEAYPTISSNNLVLFNRYDNNYPVNAKIYSFRIYNKKLTSAEIELNYIVDKDKFDIK